MRYRKCQACNGMLDLLQGDFVCKEDDDNAVYYHKACYEKYIKGSDRYCILRDCTNKRNGMVFCKEHWTNWNEKERAIVKTLLDEGLTRGAIVRRTGLPRTTIFDNIQPLIEKNLIKKVSHKFNNRGRPNIVYFLNIFVKDDDFYE